MLNLHNVDGTRLTHCRLHTACSFCSPRVGWFVVHGSANAYTWQEEFGIATELVRVGHAPGVLEVAQVAEEDKDIGVLFFGTFGCCDIFPILSMTPPH